MNDTTNQWQLFGFDASQLGHRWRAAWRDFLWGDDSPVRARLDEVVKVTDRGEVSFRHSQREVAAPAVVHCEAIVLPKELFLSRAVRLPRAAGEDLEAVMALEVNASSPFPADDTGAGWRVTGRDEETLDLELAIVSLSATMRHLGREYDCHDAGTYEVWAGESGDVLVRGFGEGERSERYRRRLVKVAVLLASTLVMLLAVIAVATFAKYLEWQRMETLYNGVQEQAREASAMRARLIASNETLVAVDEFIRDYPNPHEELARLTAMLDDTTYITQFSMQGDEITLRGISTDAAAVMQRFTGEPEYAAVTAQGPIRAFSGGLQEFHFRIALADGAAP